MQESLKVHMDLFIRQKRLEVSSPASIDDITFFTNILVEGFTALFPDLTIHQITSTHILSYIEWLEGDQSGHRLSKATIKKKVGEIQTDTENCTAESGAAIAGIGWR